MRNERRDQSGIRAAGETDPRPAVAETPGTARRKLALRGSQSRIHSPVPTVTAASIAIMVGLATGSPRAARNPMTPKAANPTAAISNRRRARTPRPTPMPSATATMNNSRASLSFVPNQATTTSLAPGGWRSMATCPTPATSEVPPGSSPASSSEAPSAPAAAATPASGYASRRRRDSGVGLAAAAVVVTGAIIGYACDIPVSGTHPRPRPTVAMLDRDRAARRRG